MPTLFQKHRAEWINCTKCHLHKTRTKVVLLRGSIPCEILFVGEAPGASEDVIGQPFIGPAGKLLDRIIKDALKDQWSYALTNLVGCIPIGEEGSKTAEPPKEAIMTCRPRLVDIIEICQPQLVVSVGTLAKKHLPGGDFATVSIIHPAAILRMDLSQKGLAIQRCIVELEMAASALVPF